MFCMQTTGDKGSVVRIGYLRSPCETDVYPASRTMKTWWVLQWHSDIHTQFIDIYQEKHFTHAHHPCSQPQCQARKFVVFSSALDLKGHMVDEHGADMTSRDKKDARRVQADFEFDEVGIGGRRNRRDRGGGSGGGNGDRDPPQHNPFTGPSRQNSRRREGFGVNLTVDGGTNTPAPPGSSRLSPSPPPEDPILAECVAFFYSFIQCSSVNPQEAFCVYGPLAFVSAPSDYRSSCCESGYARLSCFRVERS